MIPSIHKQGSRTLGLLHYLYGKGTHEEHIDPHLVASFDHLTPDPGRDPSATKKDLKQLLDQPLHLLDPDQRPEKHVWHCSVRAALDDPMLTDEQWADRSGERAQAEARLIDADYGLHRVTPGDGTAAKRTTSAELHKAERLGKERAARDELRETVRRAVAGAASEQEFFDRLAAAGVLIRQRVAPSGDLLGYKVALPDDRNDDQEPVFYAGSTLSPDLSLPRICERWSGDTPPQGTDTLSEQPTGPAPSSPAAAGGHGRVAGGVGRRRW